MKLDQDQVNELVDTVEEELTEMSIYQNIGESKVQALELDGFTVYITVVSDDYEVDDD